MRDSLLEFASEQRAIAVSINASLRTTMVVLVAAFLPNWLAAQTNPDPEPPPAASVLATPPPSTCPSDPSKSTQAVTVLSDTMGVDFTAYLDQVVKTVRQTWYSLIPDSGKWKHGKTVIQFAILSNGTVAGMAMRMSSNDVALDRAAWGAITSSTPFPFLPSQYKRPSLGLCFSFFYNPEKGAIANKPSESPTKSERPSNSVAILPSYARVFAGGIQQFSIQNGPVIWEIVGPQCAKSECGSISINGLYKAPAKPPEPPTITIKATQTIAPFQSASAEVGITPSDSSK